MYHFTLIYTISVLIQFAMIA